MAIELALHLLDLGKPFENLLHEMLEYADAEFLANRLLAEIFNHPKSTPEESD